MRLETLLMKDFTRFEDITLEFDTTINIILGANVAGKTSILDGLAYLLTGRCARTDKGGKEAGQMIRLGGKEATLSATINQLDVTRTIPGGLSIEGQYGTVTSLQEYLDGYLGADNKVVTAALNTTEFIGMKPSDQKNMLFDLMGLTFGRDDIIEKVIDEIKDEVNVRCGKMIHKMLAVAPGDLFDGTGKTWGNLYNHFKTGRRDTKRLLKEKGTQQKISTIPGLPLKADVEKRMREMSEEMASKAATLTMQKQDMERRERLNLDLTTYRGKLKTAGDPKNAQIELVKLDGELDGYNRTIKEKEKEGWRLATGAESISSTTVCPLAPELITCPLGKDKRADIVAELQNGQVKLRSDVTELGETQYPLLQKREELVAETKKNDKKDIEANIERLEGEWKEIADSAVNPKELASEIEVLRNKIDEDQGIIGDINRDEGKREVMARQDAEREVLKEQVDVLEVLVEVLGPKGLPGRILAETIGPVQEQANTRLLELTDGRYSIRLEIEPKFKILVSHDGIESPLNLLSSSEKLRVGIVLQDALVKLSGLRFLIIDNADMLDAANQIMLTETLLNIKDDYDTIIVLETERREHVLNPEIEDMTIWWLEDGEITAVK